LDGGGVFSGKKKFYKDANQTENFIGVKTENDIYYRGESTINPTRNRVCKDTRKRYININELV